MEKNAAAQVGGWVCALGVGLALATSAQASADTDTGSKSKERASSSSPADPGPKRSGARSAGPSSTSIADRTRQRRSDAMKRQSSVSVSARPKGSKSKDQKDQKDQEDKVPGRLSEADIDTRPAEQPNSTDAVRGSRASSAVDPVRTSKAVASAPRAAGLTTVVPSAARPPAAASVTVVGDVVGDLTRAVNSGPSTPGASPTLWTLLAWTRREIGGALFNRAPTAQPVLWGNTSTGLVSGNLGALDRDGDPLRYQVIDGPADGSVTIGPDGTFVFVADPELAAAGGTVTFTVRVTDVGWRLLSRPGSVDVPVTISVPEGATPADGSVTGIVEHELSGAELEYEVVGAPQWGTVEFDAEAGTFVYTPTDAARLRPDDAADTDTIVVRVSNGDESVDVTLAPQIDRFDPDVAPIEIGVGDVPEAISFSPDGTHVYVANSWDNTLSIINIVAGVTYEPIKVGTAPEAVTVSADGAHVYVVSSVDNAIQVVDTETHTVSEVIKVASGPSSIVLSEDGTRAYVSSRFANAVSVVDLESAEVLTYVEVGDRPGNLVISPDGGRVYVTNEADGSLTVIDTATNTVVDSPVVVGDNPGAVVVSPDGKRIYVANRGLGGTDHDGTVTVIDAQTLEVVGDPIVVGDELSGTVISPDGSVLYVSNPAAGSVAAIDTATGAVIALGDVGAGIDVGDYPTRLALSPDGSRLMVVNTFDNTVTPVSLGGAFTPAPPMPTSFTREENPFRILADEVRANIARNYKVVNLSTKPMRLTGIIGRDIEKSPFIRSVLPVGGVHEYDLTYFFAYNNRVLADYSTLPNQPGPRTYRAYLEARPVFGVKAVGCDSTGAGAHCDPDPTKSTLDNLKSVVTFMDPDGTRVVIPASKNGLQGETLNNTICRGGQASCQFFANRQEARFTDWHGVGSSVVNDTGQEVTTTITVSDTQSVKSSFEVGGSVKVDILKIVEMAINGKYGREWTKSHTFTQTLNIKVPPHSRVDVTASQPIIRTYGDFVVRIGNSTITLKDVYFDSPDTSRVGQYRISDGTSVSVEDASIAV